MAWGRKERQVPPPVPAKPEARPDEIISEMLAAYQHHFYETAKSRPNSTAEQAKATVDRAKKIISESRIGYSICVLLDHVKYWPTWSKRDDFAHYVGFPARDISGIEETVEAYRPQSRTTVRFTYSGTPFTFTFLDEGISSWGGDDFNRYGKIDLYSGNERVLGVDISADASRGSEYERWSVSDVSAFAPGDWMKQLVGMAALIDAHQVNERNRSADDRAIEKAKNIHL